MLAARRLAVIGGFAASGLFAAWMIHHPWRAEVPSLGTSGAVHAAGASASVAPVLWVLWIGVSRYQNPELNLKFADADARAIADVLRKQQGGPLYREARSTVLTNQQVTRETILGSMEHILSQANVDDLVVIFLAGHGVQDRTARTYYFLPYAASAENLVTAGLRMSDFDEMVRSVRRNVRGVVLMLDTCHSGALRLSGTGWVAEDAAGSRLSAGEGFFLLAAAKPGEYSKEDTNLGHGAFTYAVLQGVNGAADGDGDGLIAVSDLFGYVAREVPRLTGGVQHPYHKGEGTDLLLAAVRGETRPTAPVRVLPAPAATVSAVLLPANTIGVMEFRDLRADPQQSWVGKALRIALNTELSKVRALRVFSSDLIDRNLDPRDADRLAVAQHAGIRKLLTGSYGVVGNRIRIDAQIIDTASGVQEGSDSVQGNLDNFFDLQKKLVLSMLRRLPVEVSAEEGKSIQKRTNTNVNAYVLLLESEGIVEEAEPPTPAPRAATPAAEPHSALDVLWRGFALVTARQAFADEPTAAPPAAPPPLPETPAVSDERTVRTFLEEYRRALEGKDVDRLAQLYVTFSARQREAQRTYLEAASDLTVELSDVASEVDGDRIALSFTRRDNFTDRESGKPQLVEVRLDKTLVGEDGKWRFAK